MDTMKNLQMMAFVQYLSALLTGQRSATMPLETECCDSFHAVAIYLHEPYEECAKGTRRQITRTHYERNEFLEGHNFLRNFHKKYKKFHCACKTLLNACRHLAPDLESFNLQQIPIVKMLIEKQMFTYKFYNDTKRFLEISPYQQYTLKLKKFLSYSS